MRIPLALRLCLVDVIAPDIDAMPTDKDGVGIGVARHCLLKILCQILLMGSVLDDGYAQGVVEAKISRFGHAATEALDLLDVVNLEDLVPTGAVGLKQEADENGRLGVGMDAAACLSAAEGGQEERGALRGSVAGGRTEVETGPAEAGIRRLGGEGEDVDVGAPHELLLDARGRDVDEVAAGNGKR